MRFELGEDAAALRDAVAPLLHAEVTGAVVRAGWPGGDPGTVDAVWRRVAGTGVVAALVPEAAGGLGLDENSAVAVLEAFGHSGLPAPVVETLAVAAPLLAQAKHGALDEVLTGAAQVAAQLDGFGALVPFGGRVSYVLLRRDGALRLYERAELAMEPCATVDGSRALARVTGIRGPGTVLTDDPADIEAAWQRGVLGTAAVLVGLGARMLAMTVEHVQHRRQFGVAIGSFQAVKHALASAHLAIEFARPMVQAAAWEAAADPDASRLTSAAKVLASDAARQAARVSIQCHGAMGYTTEHDLHLFAKRVWALAPSWGGPGWHRARLAAELGMGR